MAFTVPFARSRLYQPSGTIGDLLRLRMEAQADTARQQGQISGQMWQNVGQTIQGTLGDILKQRQEAPRLAAEQEARGINIENARSEQATMRKATEDKQVLGSAMGMANQRDPEVVKSQLSEMGRGDLIPVFEKTWTDLESSRTSLKKLKADVEAAESDYFGSMAAGIKKANFDPMAVEWALSEAESDGHDVKALRHRLQREPKMLPTLVDQLIEKSPTQRKMLGEEADRTLRQTTEARALQAAKDAAADRTVDNTRQNMTATEAARHNRVMESRPTGATAPVGVIGPDGKPVFMAPSDALGKRPASNREYGRQVTSGDAGRVADFDTSLSDLAVLNTTLTETKGATGTSAAIGASMPAWATDTFGWGVDAKKRQGVIDRVKQVIGKTLEGGVLRKEDEYKYEKILPTIKDTAEVAASKLAGLKTAITQRRSTFIDALADADYDVNKFNARRPSSESGSKQKIGRFEVEVEP